MAETDMQESSGFLRSALAAPAFYYSLVVLIAAYVVSLGIAFAVSFLGRKSKRICLYVILAISLVSGGFLAKSYVTLHYRFNDPDLVYFIQHRDNPPEYYTPVTRFLGGVAYVYSSSSSVDKIRQKLLEAKVDGCTYDSPLIVLALGESYNKYHTSLYEPTYRNTTPRMCALRDSGMLVVYSDVISPYNHTNEVMHTLFSTCKFEDRLMWTDYTLFPAIFRKAGYDVTFLSNQFAIQSDDVWNQFSGGMFNKRALSELQYNYHNARTYRYDGELLAEMPDDEALRNGKNLVIVQFMGQHVNYSDRFPDEFAIYDSKNTTAKFGGETESQMLADYDNSIYYNDYVIGKLIDKVAALDAVVIYFADHGEECYDWRNKFMRSDESDIAPGMAKYQFGVPFVVYMSELYQKNHPEMAERIRKAQDKAMINTDTKNMLFHLAGLKTPCYEKRRDVLSDEYNDKLPRPLNDGVDYNTLDFKSSYGISNDESPYDRNL